MAHRFDPQPQPPFETRLRPCRALPEALQALGRRACRVGIATSAGLLIAGPVHAQTAVDGGRPLTVDRSVAGPAERAPADEPAAATPEAYSVHGQFTFVGQTHRRFDSPYDGTNSLGGAGETKETADVTLFLGARLWQGGELYFNPEFDQGFGLANTVGVAGFPSGEAYKVGHRSPYFRPNRLFLRQSFDLGGGAAAVPVEAGANALAGSLPAHRLTVTAGKLSVVDIFDTNGYAHDPRSDFLNWSIIDAGAFDYAADSWGYTDGAAAEWTRDGWTLRGGLFALSKEPNGQVPDATFRQRAAIGEVEIRHQAFFGRDGTVKLLGFLNRGRMAGYDDAIRAAQGSGGPPTVAPVRRTASRAGVVLNVEQSLGADLGFFLRASANDGRKEAFEFTEINRSLSLGLALKGCGWQRCEDTVGLAGASNRLSAAAQRYFAAGGIGILIGDGRLPNPGPEQIVEAYYRAAVVRGLALTLDGQHIIHPAYNRDRGPVTVVGLRLHAEF